jgi:hypothetical protein
VLDNSNVPIPGVTVRVLNTTRSAQMFPRLADDEITNRVLGPAGLDEGNSHADEDQDEGDDVNQNAGETTREAAKH